MAFEVGNQLHELRKPRFVYDELVRTVKQNPAKLKAAVESILDQASNGNIPALDWIACRLEGKPAQAVTVSGDDDKPLITLIRMVVVSPDSEQQLTQTIEHEPVAQIKEDHNE